MGTDTPEDSGDPAARGPLGMTPMVFCFFLVAVLFAAVLVLATIYACMVFTSFSRKGRGHWSGESHANIAVVGGSGANHRGSLQPFSMQIGGRRSNVR